MKITKIEAQLKTKGRYSVFVDDKFSFGISELGLIESGMSVGQELSKSELDNLKDQAKIDKVYSQVLSLIARRPRSQWEVEDYLIKKGLKKEPSSQILSKLSKKNFINDVDFAKRWVNNRRLLKNISRRKLRAELLQKRLRPEIVDQALSEDETDETQTIKAEIIKKRRVSRYRDEPKLLAYLARQGYNYSDIKNALDLLKDEQNGN